MNEPPASMFQAAALTAPASWRTIDFISDLHLAEGMPKTAQAWADYLQATAADAVFILGDLFEVWVGDDARHEGFEAACTGVLAKAGKQRVIGFMVGNRDFLLGAETLAACGLVGLADPTVMSAFGQRVLLSHGDAWCVSDVSYQAFRRQVRDAAWQARVLAQPLAERRLFARHMRSESERRTAAHSSEWFDVDRVLALAWMDAAEAPVLVHGHTHRPASEVLAPGRTRHVLSDWDFDHGDTPRGEVLRWQAGAFTRLDPTAARSAAS